MRSSVMHAIRTYGNLPSRYQRHISANWFDVVDVAESCRVNDGLVDGAVPRALAKCGIRKEDGERYDAHHHFLFNYFLFGEDSKAKSAARRPRGVS